MSDANTAARVTGLDLMKALGLYLVVVYHLSFRDGADLLGSIPGTAVYYIAGALMSICVPLFFVSSGALSLTRPMDLRRNTLRAAQLAILTAVWTPVSLAVVLLLRPEWPGFREFLSICWELRIGYIQHLWYMSAFLFMTLAMPLFHSLRRGDQRIYRYSLLLLGVLTFGNLLLSDGEYLLRWVTGHLRNPGTREYFWYVNYFAYHYWYIPIYFALGAFLLEHRETLRRRIRLAWIAIPVCVLCLCLFAMARTRLRGSAFDLVFNNYGDPFTLVLTGAVSVLLLSARPGDFLRRAAASMSRCSLGIYLIHWLIIEALIRFVPGLVRQVLLAPLTAIPVLGLSWGLTHLALKVPYLRDLFTAVPDWIRRRS